MTRCANGCNWSVGLSGLTRFCVDCWEMEEREAAAGCRGFNELLDRALECDKGLRDRGAWVSLTRRLAEEEAKR